MTRLLFIIPRRAFMPEYHHMGSTKDIECRLEYLKSRNIKFDLLKHELSEKATLESIKSIQLDLYSHVLIEKANYPSVLKYIKKKSPQIHLIYRGHNAEILHRWDYLKCAFKTRLKVKRQIRSLSQFTKREIITAKYADTVLAISSWEEKNYWKYLKKKTAVKFTPFYMPDKYLKQNGVEFKKEKLCVCFSSSHPGPIILDSIVNFIDLVGKINPTRLNDWKFVVTGSNPGEEIEKNIKLSNHDIIQKNFESPDQVLSKARVILILSDYGRGFKTKILEAILNQCYVFVTKGLYKRIPTDLKRYCFVINLNKPDEFVQKLEQTQNEFLKTEANEMYKKLAYQSLDEVFNVDSL